MMGFGLGHMFGGGLLGIILFGLIIYAIFTLINGTRFNENRYNRRNDALEILNEKYARGEISDEEYVRKKAMLLNA
jgi:putative membrane protein